MQQYVEGRKREGGEQGETTRHKGARAGGRTCLPPRSLARSNLVQVVSCRRCRGGGRRLIGGRQCVVIPR